MGNPSDDLLAHALRLTGIDVRMLNTSSVSMYSHVHMYTRRFRNACIYARSRHDKCAQVRRCQKYCQLAKRCQANCRHQYDRALLKTAVCKKTSCCNKSGLDCRFVQISRRLGGHRCATGCRSLPSVAPCPVRPVQRRRCEARCLPGQALAPRRLLLLRRAHSTAVRACCCIVTLRQPLRSAPDAVAYAAEGVLLLICPTAG